MLAVWRGWKVATWWRRYFVVTENWLMLITSLLDTDVGMMPLAKVTDMRLHRTTLGHALGYAEFVIESAGQDQALRGPEQWARHLRRVVAGAGVPAVAFAGALDKCGARWTNAAAR